ncbi:MAG: hypothetical protein Kow0090_03930 [Myxococcota bacterium]
MHKYVQAVRVQFHKRGIVKTMRYFIKLLESCIVLSLLVLASACGTKRIHYDLDEKVWDPTRIPKTDLQVKSYDTNRDGSPDVFEYYRLVVPAGSTGVPPTPVMVFKEMSVNFATVNVWRAYKNNGEVFREWFDTNGDGRYDVEAFFIDNKVVKKRYDLVGNGSPGMWKVFDESGLLAERALDTDVDGKPDYWEFYEGGKLKTVKRDKDRDGQPD